ncbi:acyl-CoA dehydrogenase family protein [Streptomyces megasporus]|uniref:acyl-CoA dehydrogenase family protein n=1 Tax=Streptomyces megasporus TaxID=44060 RepID=UPI0004E27515|nr:acyl-CoA dehydrogenase family protein [Streptomyces megasporus]
MSSTTHTPATGPAPLTGLDVFSSDRALVEGVERYADAGRLGEIRAELTALGRAAGSARVLEWGAWAAACPPAPRDGGLDVHPAWRRLLRRGATAVPSDARPRPDGALRRTAALLVWAQVEAGHCLSLSSTHAVAAALRAESGPVDAVDSTDTVDLVGTAGSSAAIAVGTDGVRAEPAPGGTEHFLTGRVRLRPAVLADVLLVRAWTPAGPVPLLAPCAPPEGRGGPRVHPPADAAPSRPGPPAAEVEFDGTVRGRRIGAEGRGPAVAAAVTEALRSDRVTVSAAVLRQAVVRAVHHVAHHGGHDGRALPPGEEASVRNVLADLAVEAEAAGALALRLAAARDGGTDRDRALLRVAVPAAAHLLVGRCAPAAAEALDLLGGDGCAGGPGVPALPHGAPPDPTGEDTGHRLALEVLRVVREDPEALTAFLTEIGRARGADHRLDRAIRELLGELAELEGIEARARRVAERTALVLQGALLVRHAPPEVADAFCASRLGGERGTVWGTLPPALDLAAIVERARPAVG